MTADGPRTALVTGAGSGIGRATARTLRERGFGLALLDHDAGALAAAAVELGGAAAAVVDVADGASVDAAVARLAERAGAIDVVANVAGIGSTQTLPDTPPETWEAVFAVNVRGVYNVCRATLPGMIACRRGAIVNVASVAGLVGLRDRAAYCASKGAVVALTKAMALDHVGDGIRVNCVCPGTIDTPWVGRLLGASADPVAARAALAARQPMGRLGTIEEVAGAIAYLVGEDAGFVTGTALVVDGGLVAG